MSPWGLVGDPFEFDFVAKTGPISVQNHVKKQRINFVHPPIEQWSMPHATVFSLGGHAGYDLDAEKLELLFEVTKP